MKAVKEGEKEHVNVRKREEKTERARESGGRNREMNRKVVSWKEKE